MQQVLNHRVSPVCADLKAMLSEVFNGPSPPSLIVGLLVGHVPNEVRLTGDMYLNDNQQAAEVVIGPVSCQLGACWAICKVFLVRWDQRQQAHSFASLMNRYICSTADAELTHACTNVCACMLVTRRTGMSCGMAVQCSAGMCKTCISQILVEAVCGHGLSPEHDVS